jgi:crotonobetainyl-CoA:carnitine CoA-transferase CaiB-like acyl-CoA transferase
MPSIVPPAEGPLAGVTVLDLTRVLSGPYCTMLLADMGARVIKVEQPGRGDDTRAWGPPFVEGESAYFLSLNRNKESVTLDFKHPEGRALLDRLIGRADVLVENFRPGTLARLGLDHASLAPAHPRLVYASISGFGQDGPRAAEAGYDAVIQAEGGLMSITGPADGAPHRLGVAVADFVSGLFAAQGVLAALLARASTGRGQLVDVGMLDAVTALLTYQAGSWFATGEVPRRLGNRHPSIAPYDTFAAADGEFVLAVGNDVQFRAFSDVIGDPALATDPRYDTNAGRVQHYATLQPRLAERLARHPRAYWLARLTAAGVPAGSVRSVAEALGDPQLAARDMVVQVTHPTAGAIRQLGVPVKLSDTPGSVRCAPPLLGQHTEAVLAGDLGLDAARLASLRAAGVI